MTMAKGSGLTPLSQRRTHIANVSGLRPVFSSFDISFTAENKSLTVQIPDCYEAHLHIEEKITVGIGALVEI